MAKTKTWITPRLTKLALEGVPPVPGVVLSDSSGIIKHSLRHESTGPRPCGMCLFCRGVLMSMCLPGFAALRFLHPEEAAWLGAFCVPGTWRSLHEKPWLHRVATLNIRDLFRGGELFPECQARGQAVALQKRLVLRAIAFTLLREGLRGAADPVLILTQCSAFYMA